MLYVKHLFFMRCLCWRVNRKLTVFPGQIPSYSRKLGLSGQSGIICFSMYFTKATKAHLFLFPQNLLVHALVWPVWIVVMACGGVWFLCTVFSVLIVPGKQDGESAKAHIMINCTILLCLIYMLFSGGTCTKKKKKKNCIIYREHSHWQFCLKEINVWWKICTVDKEVHSSAEPGATSRRWFVGDCETPYTVS